MVTLPVRKTIVQTSKRQGSNINKRQAHTDAQAAFDDPPYEPLKFAQGGSNYDDMEEHYEKITD